ncbi:MAG: hypothetical protein ACOVNL_03185 [Prochlorococcaceae cyanobacterium]|jgi:hypothetical protein
MEPLLPGSEGPAPGGQPPPRPAEPAAAEETAQPLWEYRVLHINVESNSPPGPPNPKEDSNRLGGALSPEFLQREFPDQYKGGPRKAMHPAEQLQGFLNQLGRQGWELIETTQVGPLLMFIFKRPGVRGRDTA